MRRIPDITEHYVHFDECKDAIRHLRQQLGTLRNLDILEAGCGSLSHVDFSECDVTAVDISRQQLDRNNSVHEKICADLHTYENEAWAGRFDFVISWFVVEHLHSPSVVIDKFMRWLSPNGKIILAYPQLRSLKGVVTRHTPHLVHRLFYLAASGTPLSANKVDKGPFPTIMHRDLQLERLAENLSQKGFQIDLLLSAESYQTKFIKRFASSALVDAINRWCMGKHCPGLERKADDLILIISRSDQQAGDSVHVLRDQPVHKGALGIA